MNIQGIALISFTGRIIDSHSHVGRHEGQSYTKDQLDVFVKSELPNKDTVEKMIVSDLDVLHNLKGEYEGNKAALEMFRDSDKYVLLASCNPKDGNVENIKKLFKEYPDKFIGLKFHSDVQNLPLSDKRYEPYMKFASENKIPCLFHSAVELIDGKVNPNLKHISDPESIYSLAKKYPKTPVVIAHLGAGWNESHDKAIDVLAESVKKGDANLYADISWVDIDHEQTHIVKAIKRLKGIGEDRLMFGTDAPIDRFSKENARETYSNYVEAIKTSIRNDKDLKPNAEAIIDDLFYNNAEKLYLKKKTPPSSSNKRWLIAGTIAAILGGLLIWHNNKKSKQIDK